MSDKTSDITCCMIIKRDGDPVLFDQVSNGYFIVHLNRYLIVPLEVVTDAEMEAMSMRWWGTLPAAGSA